MPDFERVFDEISLDLANTPEERARAEGFIAGKNYARREIAYMVIFFAVTGLIIWTTASAL